jgi:hypothetical protein
VTDLYVKKFKSGLFRLWQLRRVEDDKVEATGFLTWNEAQRWADEQGHHVVADPSNPYSVKCPTCGSDVNDPCFMRRPPWDACAWPHPARRKAARSR